MRNITLLASSLAVTLLAACGGSDPPSGNADMAGGGTGLTLPTDCAAGVTAASLVGANGVYTQTCAFKGCHNGGSTFNAVTADDLKTLAGKAATQTTKYKLVAAGSPEQSYLIYKLYNKQSIAGGNGDIMPQSKPMLAKADLCKFIT